jgi:hypothetical protein
MEKEQELPIIILLSEDKKLKIAYYGGDNLFISDETHTIAVHLGNVEFLQESINNL